MPRLVHPPHIHAFPRRLIEDLSSNRHYLPNRLGHPPRLYLDKLLSRVAIVTIAKSINPRPLNQQPCCQPLLFPSNPASTPPIYFHARIAPKCAFPLPQRKQLSLRLAQPSWWSSPRIRALTTPPYLLSLVWRVLTVACSI